MNKPFTLILFQLMPEREVILEVAIKTSYSIACRKTTEVILVGSLHFIYCELYLAGCVELSPDVKAHKDK